MSPALVIGHPTTLVVSILLIPVILFLSVFLPGNKFLPLASLAGMFYLFPCVLPITKGNVPKTFVIGLVALVAGLFFVTNLTPAFTKAIAAANCDGIAVPEGFDGGAALDFASALWCWSIYQNDGKRTTTSGQQQGMTADGRQQEMTARGDSKE